MEHGEAWSVKAAHTKTAGALPAIRGSFGSGSIELPMPMDNDLTRIIGVDEVARHFAMINHSGPGRQKAKPGSAAAPASDRPARHLSSRSLFPEFFDAKS